MTCEEVQNILNERRNLKIATRLEIYEEALKRNPLETPKVLTRRRPPEIIAKARDLKWSAVAFRSASDEKGSSGELQLARDDYDPDSSPLQDRGEENHALLRAGKLSAAARPVHSVKKFVSPGLQPSSSLPQLPALPAENPPSSNGSARIDIDFDRLQRTTAIESIRLRLQKEQLKQIQAKFDSIKSFPGYIPPPTVVHSNADEQLQAPWRSKALHPRPAREKKPWALPEPLRPRRKKKAVAEVVVEEQRAEEVVAAAPVKSVMELMMMGMDDGNDDENDVSDHDDPPADSVEQQQPVSLEDDAKIENVDIGQSSVADSQLPATESVTVQEQGAVAEPPDEAERPGTSASAISEADSIFTRDSEALSKKKAIVLTGEANHAIIMSELEGNIDFEDILLEKVLSGEEIYKISTSKGNMKPLRNGDLFLLGRFLKGNVMLVPESYQESDSSGTDDDNFPEIASRASGSRGGPRSQGSKSRSRSRPSTRDGDTAFVMASDFVQVAVVVDIFLHQNSFVYCVHS
jgi:hypothetical protein